MTVLSLNHYSIRTTDLERSGRFYQDVLGLSPGPRPPFSFPGLWLYGGDGTALLHLIGVSPGDNAVLADYLGEGSNARGGGAIDHIAFFCADFDLVKHRLTELQVAFRERQVPLLALRQLFVTDPHGVVLELNFPSEGQADG
jgi:catechol 2,3-dioxygenase-like lactoylglutathione lyase family enzyme